MSDLIVVASPHTYLASLGRVLDAHALLAELYDNNPALSVYSRMHTGVKVLTADGAPVSLAGGRTLAADGGLSRNVDARLVYVAAFEAPDAGDVEAALGGSEPLSNWLREQKDRGAVIAAAGAGVWRLARAGLLAEGVASVEPRLTPAFRRAFPRIRVEGLQGMSTAGDVLTCGAPALEGEFVVRAVAQALSPGVAQWLAMRWGAMAEAGLTVQSDPLVARAQLWIRERFTQSFRIQDLSATLSVSHQTLIRRFRLSTGATPRDYAQGLRIHAAKMMLRETPRTVSEIAALVGYSDLPSFREVFRAREGVTPAGFRARERARRSQP
ncbi:helix-turn-helix domain-containing protein [Phenylobacterium sp.]|uniref:helix-turn-helix domain-containing protein n=1 Tax=Phenylobacterium sp. TaxID=1871053 RepID=UPI002ED97F11